METTILKDLFNLTEMLSVPAILVGIVWWLERRFSKLELKHDTEMKELKDEHTQIMKALHEEHKNALKAQREAHLHEKTEFFGGLNKTLSELIKELQISNEVRNKISFDMAEIKAYQHEMRETVSIFSSNINELRTLLNTNSEKLSLILKCDLSDDGGKNELKREFENTRRF